MIKLRQCPASMCVPFFLNKCTRLSLKLSLKFLEYSPNYCVEVVSCCVVVGVVTILARNEPGKTCNFQSKIVKYENSFYQLQFISILH